MPVYTYQGRREATGELVSGSREAASHAQLGQDLLKEGVLLTRYEVKGVDTGVSLFSSVTGRVPILERVLFARYFALMLRAGLDVKQALEALSEQTRNQGLRKAIKGIKQGIERGAALGDSMEEFPRAFSSLFVSFVRVGETTGKLNEALQILAKQLQKEYDLRRAVRGALLYPVVIVVALVAVSFAMLTFVVPRLAEVFDGFDVDLPLATRVLIGIGHIFDNWWWLILILALILGVIGWMLWRVKKVKNKVMASILFMPVISPIIVQVNMARFSRSLSSLIESGVPFVEALSILGDNTPHQSYAKVFQGAREHVKKGRLLSEYLGTAERLFPPLIVNVVKVGEETGALSQVLEEIASFYEGEVDQTMKNLTSILEPVLMVVIGLAVGALAISIISPIYNLVNVI